MSGVVKKVKKVFKKVVKFVKKVAPIILMAAAVYFTAGIALSAFPATASFAASMPGFAGGGFLGLGVGSGASAGTGILTKVAAKFGLATLGSSGGLVGGAAAAGTTATELGGAVGSKVAMAGISKGLASGAVASIPAGTATLSAQAAAGSALAGGGVTGGLAASNLVAKAGMTLGEKFLLASTASQFASGLMAPSAREIEEAQKRWVGAFYGVDEKGNGAPAPAAQSRPSLIPPASAPASPARTVPSVSMPRRNVPADTRQARQLIGGNGPLSETPYSYGKDSLPALDAPFQAMQEPA